MNPQPIFFKAPWGTSAIITTVLVFLIILGVSYIPLRMAMSPGMGLKAIGLLTLILMVGILAVSYLFSPTGYSLGSDHLIIIRPIKSVTIPLQDIVAIEMLAPDMLNDSTRILGSGGLWGMYGKFQNNKLGTYKLYVRNANSCVLVRAKETYVISPERISEFIETTNHNIHNLSPSGSIR